MKLLKFFNSWTEKGSLPSYCSTSRVIPLSKTDNPFPEHGDIRTISITPALTKLYEKLIMPRLEAEINARGAIHAN